LESDNYRADYKKAHQELGWEPTIEFKELVRTMVENNIKIKSSYVANSRFEN